MSDPSGFADLRAQMFELYNAKQYEDAFELVTEQGPHYPAKRDTVSYWRACLAARTGQESLAEWILEEALATGTWWAPEWLRDDDDFETMQGRPEFERLVEICTQRRDAAAARAVPAHMVAEPAGTPPWPALVALHGAGSTASTALADWHAAVSLGWLLALPQSTVPSGPDQFRWGTSEIEELQRCVASLSDGGRIDPGRLVLGGFSAGGRVALQAAIEGAIEARGVIAVAPAPFEIERLDAAAGRGLRIFVIAGGRDLHGSGWSKDFAAECERTGVACTLDFRPELSHVIPPDFDEVLPHALDFCLDQ